MTLIKSISGIRGTIGDKVGEGLSPQDIVKFAAAFGSWIKLQTQREKNSIVLGRDARISGKMVQQLISGTLLSLGIDVIDIGLATTPTTEMDVVRHKADGGIIITASHNPVQWNALKLLNEKGEFLSATDGKEVLEIATKGNFKYSEVFKLGKVKAVDNALEKHVDEIIKLELVDIEAIAEANFTVAIDAVNSVGGIALPYLLKRLGVNNVLELYCEPNGLFPHNPEPLPENLTEISAKMKTEKADVGFVVDPDVDRLAILNEDGSMFGEEYTLVAIADYILQHKKGNTVSNLSSTRALRDVTEKHGMKYASAAVGEVNVVNKMKETKAVIGGEGNGGVIYPELHYGRDALVGIALFLSYLSKSGMSCSALRAQYPDYYISKNKVQLSSTTDVDGILTKIYRDYQDKGVELDTTDGLKITFSDEWVQLRKSNTEPIIRIYSESNTPESANKLAQEIMRLVDSYA